MKKRRCMWTASATLALVLSLSLARAECTNDPRPSRGASDGVIDLDSREGAQLVKGTVALPRTCRLWRPIRLLLVRL